MRCEHCQEVGRPGFWGGLSMTLGRSLVSPEFAGRHGPADRLQQTGGLRLESGNNHQRRRLARGTYLPKAHYDPRGLKLLPPDLGPLSF